MKNKMDKAIARVRNVLKMVDIVLMLIDARFPEDTKIPMVIREVKKRKKKLIFVVTKGDLVMPGEREKMRQKGYIVTSAKYMFGKKKLLNILNTMADKKGRKIYVGVVGYPDVGKSSFINYLVGRKKTKVSPIAHTTIGQQYIRLNDKVTLVDTPGIAEDKSLTSLAIKGGVSPEQVSDAIPIVRRIVNRMITTNKFNRIEEYYDFKPSKEVTKENIDDIVSELLLHIAKKRNLKIKGGEYNIDEAAKIMMREFQRGKW